MESANVLKNHLINGRYKAERKIDHGTYSTVYLGIDKLSKKKVAIKVESVNAGRPTIPHESAVYQHLKNWDGFPHILYAGQEKGYNIIVMELLGASLKHVYNNLGNKFSLKTVLQLADQILLRLQTLHGLHFVHCDLKPANLMMGRGDKSGEVYLIDFGLARQYFHRNKHLPCKSTHQHFVGNPAFAARNAHLYRTLSRRDDLESLGYVLVYFITGTLPWETSPTDTFQTQIQQIQRIKLSINIEMLCQGVPPVFIQYFQYVRELRYDDTPDYNYLRQLFRTVAAKYKYKYDRLFEWNKPNTTNVA